MTNNLKLLYIAFSRLPTEKAHGYQIMKMCEAFSKNNNVLLLYPKRRNIKKLNKYRDIFRYYEIKNRFEKRRLPSLEIWILKKIKMQKVWFFTHSISYSIKVLLFVLHYRKDFKVIYSRDLISLYVLSSFRKLLISKPRIVYESHTFPRNIRGFKIKLAKRVDRLVVVTNKLKELYVNAGVDNAKIIVEPDAVDLDKFNLSLSIQKAREKLTIPDDIKIASFVGNFHTMQMEKGIPEIIESAEYLIDEFPNLFFYFIGGPLDREKNYRIIIKNKNLPQEKFVFLGKQPLGDVPLWLKASDILLMPFPQNKHFSDFMSPLKMFEYMASKRPIVGSKLPAIEEILTDRKTALLGQPGDPKAIAKNIGTLLLDQKIGENLAENAFNLVQKYTWDKRAKRIMKCLD